MKHLKTISKPPAPAQSSVAALLPLGIKLIGIIAILDRLARAQLQAPWKTPF